VTLHYFIQYCIKESNQQKSHSELRSKLIWC